MEDIIVDAGVSDAISMPFMSIRQFDASSMPYTEPNLSFWSNPEQSMEQPSTVRARVFRVEKDTGLMNVIGIDADINIDVPITHNYAGTEFHGDVSLPAVGWEVLLIRSANGDYYPIKYKRPYSEQDGWSHNIPDDMESGDWGVTSSGGGKMLMFDSGLIQMESSPSCMRSMSPLEDDERIEDLCRRYGLHSDAGKFIAAEYDNSPTNASRLEFQANEKLASATNPLAKMVMGSFDLAGATGGAKIEVTDPTTKQSKGNLQINRLGLANLDAEVSVSINSKRVALGSDKATEPVALGAQLLTRILAIEAAIAGLQAGLVAHTHVYPNPATPGITGPGVPVTALTPLTGSPNFLSTTCFAI